jgi:hypothetical protein
LTGKAPPLSLTVVRTGLPRIAPCRPRLAIRRPTVQRAARAQRDAELKIEVQRVFAENFGVYGANGATLVRRQGMTSVRSAFPRSLSE